MTLMDDIDVVPEQLLHVTCERHEQAPMEVLAVMCHYVTATNPDGQRAVGIELVYDPLIQSAYQLSGTIPPAYVCPVVRLKSLLLDPRTLKKIAPIEPSESAPLEVKREGEDQP